MNAQSRLRTYLPSILAPGELEGLAAGNGLESVGGLAGHGLNIAAAALQKLATGAELTREEQFVTEAIIIPDKRPAIAIVKGDFTVTHPLWMHFQTDAAIHRRITTAIPSVGRIELPGHPSLPYGGTGFVVGDNLLMTNRHVAEIFAEGLGSQIRFRPGLSAGVDFLRETISEAATLLRIVKVRMIHPYWDMALLEVAGLDGRHPALVLSTTDPDDRVGADVAVIGYPAFDPRNDAAVQQQVFGGLYNIKRLQPGRLRQRAQVASFGHTVLAATHDGSTLGGDSGAAVLDTANGLVAALHFGGIYLKSNYGVPASELAKDSRVIDAGVNFAAGARPAPSPSDQAWKDLEPATPPTDGAVLAQATGGPTGSADGAAHWSIPIEVSIRLGQSTFSSAPVPPADTSPRSVTSGESPSKMVEPYHDKTYEGRSGYDPNFLGVVAPAPEATDPSQVAPTLSGGHQLDYHNFTVVMHAARRLAMFTASNISGEAALRTPEPGRPYSRAGLSGLGPNQIEKWFNDPRLSAQFQLPDSFFTRDREAFDKGHIVRREDVAWGSTYELLRRANGDTYHVTNCSPQVAGFNQSQKGIDNWGDLENEVMRQAKTERLSLFAGPVLANNDPVFVGVDDTGPIRVRVPQRFWKVVLARKDGQLQAFAFVLDQDLSGVPFEFVVDEAWRRRMISLAELELELGTVRFGPAIHAADQAGTAEGAALRARVEDDVHA